MIGEQFIKSCKMDGFGEECRKMSNASLSFRMKTAENGSARNLQQSQLARDSIDKSQCEMCWERTRLSSSTCIHCFKNEIRNPKPNRNNIEPSFFDWTLYGIEMLVVPLANSREHNVIELKYQDVKSKDFKIRNDQFTQKEGANLYPKRTIKAYKDIPIPLSNNSSASITTILLIILMAITYTTAAAQETHQWDVSMVVDNVDYTTGMEKNMSREFTDLADTLCLGLSGYLMEKKEQRVGCHVERLRKSATSKVEVSLTIDNLPLKVFGSKDKVLSRILQESRHLSKNGKDYIEIKSYLIPTTSIHVLQKTETGPQLSKPILDSERPRRGVNTSKLPVVSEGTPLVTTTPKSRVTTVEIVWATNWWDVFLSKYQWGEEDLFGSETGATLSRLPEVDNCLHEDMCKNGGTCVSDEMSYSCVCQEGWTGVHCEKDLDECARNPCNGRPCTNTVGSYRCACPDGFTGKDCTEDIDECRTNPCTNNGVCTNTKGSYLCTCSPGWTSSNCQDDVDECDSSPCKVGSVCVNSEGSYTCECEKGWGGKNCTDDVDECSTSPCGNNGVCKNTVGSFQCSCSEGWSGSTCENDLDECLSSPCHHGAVCKNTKGSYSCSCSEGWSSKDCNEDIDECKVQQPCANGGLCTNIEGSFECACAAGWTGVNCTDDVDECFDSPCGESVPCVNVEGSYSCECLDGWTGKNCTEDVNECETQQPCANGGVCTNMEGTFECTCATGWTGTNCTDDVDECVDSPCGDRVPCINVEGSYSCRCLPGWSGQNCTEDIDECTDGQALCTNRGSCVNLEGSYRCDCINGWTGKSCNEDLDECADSPCPDGSSCINRNGTFLCDCMEGWTGQYCELDIDECLSVDCGYEGVCNNLNGSFACDCPSGYTGTPCADVDECSDDPCINGGICKNNVGSFTCTCAQGWEGETCSKDVDECAQNPCSNGGVCQNMDGTYHCDCPASLVGKDCTARMFLMGAEGQYGSSVTISCGVQGLDDWQTIEIRHNNRTLYQVNPSGLFTDFTNSRVAINSTAVSNGAEVSLTFRDLHCEDDGQYQCMVDGNSKNTMNLVVNKPSSGEPTRIIKQERFVDNRNTVRIQCQGHPSYPNGNLKFQVKMKNELVFKDFTFPVDVQNELSADCSRTQIVTITSAFDQNWDQATIKCLEDDSGNFDKTVLDIIPDNYCVRAPSNTMVYLEHPHNPRKFVQCSNQQPTIVQECDTGSCFNENDQKCGSCIKECSENPCSNGAACWIVNGVLTCDCVPGWGGSLCEQDIDECISSPCHNGGLCKNTPGTYMCDCTAGWQGPLCEIDVDECLANPCANGGQCYNNIASFTCVCPPGWTGPRCDIDIDECLNSPCQNNGICQNAPGTYMCECTSGWTGLYCEEDIDECLLNPCTNSGRCNNLIGSFSCDCPEPWFGKICESGLFVDGHRGAINSEKVLGVSCTIYKYQDWKHLAIIRSDKSNRPVVRVMSDGNIKTAFNKRNVQVIYTPDEANEQAEVSLQFTRLRCQDEGVYKCLLDNGQNQDAKVVTTNPSRGKPVISKIEELYGEGNIAFNCTGFPGYPDGDLEFQIKLQNETSFHDFTFYSANRKNIDLGCVRKQFVNATYFMNMEWNQAKIRCKAKGSDIYDETNVYLLSPEICGSVRVNSGIRHPYNPGKFITCTRESPKVRNCPGTTCFDDRSQQCLFTCDNDD